METEDVVFPHTDTHDGILLSHKKIWNNAIFSNMNAPKDCHTEWSKLEKEKYSLTSFLYGI